MKTTAKPRTALAAGVAKVLQRLHYPLDVLFLCVRWYVAYSLSLRKLEEIISKFTGADDMPLPAEIMPFLVANNRLFSRVLDAMAMQRRFVADAAHELRSPLTVLTLQAERLSLSDMSAEARERFTALRAGLTRARTLIEQLLTLARVQDETVDKVQSVSIGRVLRLVLEELMPLAQARHLDIGVVEEIDANVPAGETDLSILLKNLIDNAIRYTPDGGRIDLSMTQDAEFSHIHIDDTGPGIAPDERERVFDRFYQVLGRPAQDWALRSCRRSPSESARACNWATRPGPITAAACESRSHFRTARLCNRLQQARK